MRLGFWLDDLGRELRPALAAARTWGAEAAGLDAFGAEVNPRVLTGTARRDLARRFRGSGVALAALRADVGARRLNDPARLDVNLTRLKEAFELAAQVGAPLLVVPLGLIPKSGEGSEEAERAASSSVETGRERAVIESGRTRDEGTRKHDATLVEALGALARFASGSGVRLAVPAGQESAGELSAFLDAHSPGGLVQVDLNPGRFVSRGADPLKALNRFSARVGLATAADHYRGGGEAPFGKGDAPWGELLAALSILPEAAQLPILAECTRECDRVQALRDAVLRLRKLREKPMG
jgi:sugar phosphate isomerase/epimerase